MRRINGLRVGIVSSIRKNALQVGDFQISFDGSGYAGSTYTTTSETVGQWYADGNPISGATDRTYVMIAENEGKVITHRVGEQTSNEIRLFVPSDLSGITGWWDAAATSTLTLVGNKVSNWVSRVGTAAWAQTTDAARPTWSATGRNGLPAVVTSGAQRMTLTNNNILATGLNPSHTFITAFNSALDASFRAILNWASTSSGTARGFGRNTSLNVFFTGSNTSTDNFSDVSWANVDKIQSTSVTNTGSTMHIDGAATPFVRLVTYNTANNTSAALFGDINGGSFWIGSAQDVINFNRPLMLAERQLVEGYLAAKWNLRALLPVGHPYKTAMPINRPTITISSGTGYFGSTYTTSSNTPGQWHADGSPIPDATSKSYVMNGQYDGKEITWVDENGTSNPIKMWTPDQLGSKLVCWYDAAMESSFTYGTGTQVSSWANRVSGAVPAIQTVASKRPVRQADGLKTGHPAVVADGLSQQFTMASGFALNDQTGYVVFRTADAKTNASWWNCPGIWGNEISGFPNDFGWGLQGGKPAYGAGNTSLISTSTFVNDNTPRPLSFRRSASGSTAHSGGSSNISTGTTQTGTRVVTTGITSMFNMTAYNDIPSGSSSYLSAAISEFIIINQIVSADERILMDAYSVWRWNLSVSYLSTTQTYRTYPPRVL